MIHILLILSFTSAIEHLMNFQFNKLIAILAWKCFRDPWEQERT